MRIKKLEIVGFKSFADRTVLHFNEPITGVIGPNGCGKSNVVDAIRWCMGEQSAKHLRGKAMEDVIFSGSDRRGPLGYCEVALTFENDGRVPIDYLQYTEITVGRRLFRDGTSEYYLNKTPCRLRDVTEFFLGTGIGTRAYSIIEQGRVGMIVSSKPEERRFLIEEAAGITKYKIKRKAAEKKIELTRQNLLRVSDVVAEQEKQLVSLKRQAQKAERYKQYRAELRDIELWGQSQRWLGLYAEQQVFANALSAASEKRERAQADLSATEAKLAAARLLLLGEEGGVQALQEELYALDNVVKLGEAENEHARKEEAQLLSQAQRMRGEVELLEAKAADAACLRERMAADLLQVESGGAGQADEIASRENELKQVKENLAKVTRLCDAAKAEISRQNAEIARSEADERGLLRQRDDVALRLMRAEEERGRLSSRKQELEQITEDQEEKLSGLQDEKVSLVKNRAEAEDRLKELKMQVTRLDKEVDQLKGELHKKRARLHSLGEIAAKYEGFATGTKVLLQRSEQAKKGVADGRDPGGLLGVVADMIIAPAEVELALDAVLGERLGALVVESHDHAVAAIHHLRDRGEGRASFVPLDARPTRPGDRPQLPDDETSVSGVRGRMLDLIKARPGYEAVLDALLGNVLVVETVAQALGYYRVASEDGSLSPGGLLVTLDGVLCDGHGILSGGAQKGQGASVLAQKREIRELSALCADLDRRFREKDEQLAVSKAEQQHLSKQLEDLSRAGHQGEMQILSLDKDLTRSREELHRTEHRHGVLSQEIDELSERRDDSDREAEETRMAIRDSRDLLLGFESQRDEHSREQLRLLERSDHLSAELTHLKVQVAAHKEKLRSLQEGLFRLHTEEGERSAYRERLEKEIRECYRRSAELVEGVTKRNQRLIEDAGKSRRLAEELQMKRSAYEERRGQLTEGEGVLREQRGREGSLLKETSRLQVRLGEVKTARAHLEEAVLERHRLHVSEVVHDYHLRPQAGEKEDKRARELRELIDRMGEINLMAIEEYNELDKRHGFLVAQKTDLETALKQLEQAIALINRTSKQRFREVFDLVNAKFQEIFPRCFVGGQARLVLTNEDDLLESGIEIVAQPPGKRNQTVELLSGGEKAMTAVALIFAIFLIKPSPFCLLDEVDAPLDEANVGRFNDLVREMTDRSQFIIITHNKRTMQIADTLYGVTMEEPGASKLVSVNLGDLAKLDLKKSRAA